MKKVSKRFNHFGFSLFLLLMFLFASTLTLSGCGGVQVKQSSLQENRKVSFILPDNQSDSTFNSLAMRVYNSNSPYTYTQRAYTYNAIPVTTTMSGCKLISIIRRTQGFLNPRYWAVENYKICEGNITEVKNTNMVGWDNLPQGIKPVINNTISDAKQYGKAKASYNGYRIIARTWTYIGTVYVYVLNGIKLEVAMKF
ncbi:MAG: hypothetical protein M1412_04125 [Deltaproteobacteria bacterium]|nr:hypothetical protein [Deltaproteobacteria bacterium]MCL5892339.1 hypothetical protein [Deltaproteobacteria bacterium]